MSLNKFQSKEVLNAVLNDGEDALKVDIDNVTLDGSSLTVEMPLPSGIGHGSQTSNGTAAVIESSTEIKYITMTANHDNTGRIHFGGSAVSTATGAYLEAGDSWSGQIDNLNLIYIIATQVGDGVTFTYFT
tara:strand:+ start:3874 stop:4266 length:393 start_codon:yes stop_codon:yes gene_type:complete